MEEFRLTNYVLEKRIIEDDAYFVYYSNMNNEMIVITKIGDPYIGVFDSADLSFQNCVKHFPAMSDKQFDIAVRTGKYKEWNFIYLGLDHYLFVHDEILNDFKEQTGSFEIGEELAPIWYECAHKACLPKEKLKLNQGIKRYMVRMKYVSIEEQMKDEGSGLPDDLSDEEIEQVKSEIRKL